MNRHVILPLCLLAAALAACEKMKQEGPPPTYESSTLGVARSISGTAQATPASAASSPGGK